MFHHGVGYRHQVQRLPPVAQLPPRLLATRLPQALGLALQSVARRRLAAVLAVLGRARLQVAHLRSQRLHLRPQERQFAHLRS